MKLMARGDRYGRLTAQEPVKNTSPVKWIFLCVRDEAEAQARALVEGWEDATKRGIPSSLAAGIAAHLLAAVEAERAECEAVLRARCLGTGSETDDAFEAAAAAIAARKPQP